jgi:hypothetical protein
MHRARRVIPVGAMHGFPIGAGSYHTDYFVEWAVELVLGACAFSATMVA